MKNGWGEEVNNKNQCLWNRLKCFGVIHVIHFNFLRIFILIFGRKYFTCRIWGDVTKSIKQQKKSNVCLKIFWYVCLVCAAYKRSYFLFRRKFPFILKQFCSEISRFLWVRSLVENQEDKVCHKMPSFIFVGQKASMLFLKIYQKICWKIQNFTRADFKFILV